MSRWRDIKKGNANSATKKKEDAVKMPSFEPCASISSRLKAFLTDSFLITTPILYIVIYLIMGSGEAFAQNKGNGWIIIIAVNSVIILTFWLKSGQTPGLKAYGLKLISATTKEKIGFLQAISRYLLTLFSLITLFLMFLPFLRKDKRTFQDLFSDSYIIEE